MKKPFFYLFPFFCLTFFSFCLLTHAPLLNWLELKTIDWRFLWRGPAPTTGQTIIVAIDEKSLHQEGRWPWPRQKIGNLIQKINSMQPAFIEMDIIFAEPAIGDESLIQSLRESKKSVLGYYFYQNLEEMEKAQVDPQALETSLRSILPTAFPTLSFLQEKLPQMVGLVSNIPPVAQATLSQGYFNAFADPDGTIRRQPLMVSYKNHIFPSMGLETLTHFEGGFNPVPVRENDGALKGLSLGKRFIPTNERGEILINYRGGSEQFPSYSATDILQGKISPKVLRGKTVLIGATAVGIYDLRVTPISPILPGILVQANLLDNLIKGDFLLRDVWTQVEALVWMIFLTLFLSILLPQIRILTGLLGTLFFLCVYGLGAKIIFEHGSVLPLSIPSLEILSLTLGITIYRGLTEEREKKMIRTAFQSYLHPDLVKELTQNLKNLKLGGQKVTCTILFSDVRNFTSISEKMDPQTLVDLMNNYFDPISKAIIEQGGYIDKFIGDAVMAIFGAPKKTEDHPLQACRAALAMIKIVNELEPQFKEKYGIKSFRIGVGLNTGEVIVGNMGTKQRLNYTVMGDNVNLASRLESANKDLKTEICMSEATYRKVKDEMKTRYINEIFVKGKEEKIRVYELL